MSTYTVVAPCAYEQDGWTIRLRRPGATVELDDATAAKLGAAVAPAGTASAPAAPREPEPVPAPAPPKPAPAQAAPDGNT